MNTINSFAAQWIADWNGHDVETILHHYAPDIVFHSPKVARFTGGELACFTSREQLRPYFSRAFEIRPNLQFDLLHVATDANGVALVYRNELGEVGVEQMDLNEEGLVTHARVLYTQIGG
jgi:SnoaL-like domain